MSFTYRASGTAFHSAGAATTTVGKPLGTTSGDLLLAQFHHGDSSYAAPTSVPDGWTLAGYNNAVYMYNSFLYWKVAGASEPDTYDWVWASTEKSAGVIHAYYGGFDPADPIAVFSNTAYAGYDTVVRAASMTVATANSPIVWLSVVYNSLQVMTVTPPTVPAQFTEDYDSGERTSDVFFSVAHIAAWDSTGESGSMDGTLDQIKLYSKYACAVALNPEPFVGYPPFVIGGGVSWV